MGPAARCFPPHANFGQWLRWEAALEEIRTYYSVPGAFRYRAIRQPGRGVTQIIDASPIAAAVALRAQSSRHFPDGKMQLTTIFPSSIERDGPILCLNACKDHQKLRRLDCMIGQPVGWNDGSAAALRISISARHVT